jgi:hypothetical protein
LSRYFQIFLGIQVLAEPRDPDGENGPERSEPLVIWIARKNEQNEKDEENDEDNSQNSVQNNEPEM